jgi:hypothetical protein
VASVISIVEKLEEIAKQPISRDEKIAASRRAILLEKLEHMLRLADIVHRNNQSEPYGARWELDIERRVSRLEIRVAEVICGTWA